MKEETAIALSKLPRLKSLFQVCWGAQSEIYYKVNS